MNDIYRSGLKLVAEKEVGGLYAQPSLDGCDKRPADVLAHTSEGAMAIDVTITDPTCKTALEKNSHIIPLIAAKTRHDVKVANHRKQVEKTGGQGLPFTLVPLAFETTGAMGRETQKWWKSVIALEAERRVGAATSRLDQGLDSTWTANDFSSYWLQALSMAHARTQAESILTWISKCQPEHMADVLVGQSDGPA